MRNQQVYLLLLLTSASLVLLGQVAQSGKRERKREIGAIQCELGISGGWFTRKPPKLSPEETLQRLKVLNRLLGEVLDDDATAKTKYKEAWTSTRNLIEASEISPVKCHIHYSNRRLTTLKWYEKTSDNIWTYLKHWTRKLMAVCAQPVEEAAAKIDAATKRALRELTDAIAKAERARLRRIDPTEADYFCTSQGVLAYMESKGGLVLAHEQNFKVAYEFMIEPLCEMAKFEPRERINIFRTYLGTDLLTEVSQEAREMAEFYRTCYAITFDYWQTYDLYNSLSKEDTLEV